MLGYLISLVFIGLIVGALGRLALPGRDPMSIPMTIAVGLAGSFLAGLVARALFGRGAGIVLAVLCSTFLVWVIRRARERSATGDRRRGAFGL